MTYPRTVVMQKLTEICKEEQDFHTHRGVINWATWGFEEHPKTISIHQDEGFLFPSAKMHGMRLAVISLEVFGKMSNDNDLNDGITEDFLLATERILSKLQDAREQNNVVVFGVHLASVRYTEHYDSTVGVQGVITTFDITF